MFYVKNKKEIALIIILILVFSLTLNNKIHAAETLEIVNVEWENIDGKTAKIKWQTNTETTGKVVYGLKNDELSYFIGDANSARTYHEVILSGLRSKTDYYCQIIANSDSEQVSSYVYKFKSTEYKDSYTISISDLHVDYVGGNSAFISWETDRPSNSIVEYDEKGTYKQRASSNGNSTNHQVIIKNLKPNFTYSLRAFSTDSNKNKFGYAYKTFNNNINLTASSEDLKINYLRPSSNSDIYVSASNFRISFKTDHYAKGTIKVSGKNFKAKTFNLDYGSDHEIVVQDLKPETKYDVQINMTDIFNKKSNSNFSITTKSLSNNSSNASTGASLASYPESGNTSVENLKCNNSVLSSVGYYGQYFATDENTKIGNNKMTIDDFNWRDRLRTTKVDQNLNFGKNFYGLGKDSQNRPIHFFGYWRAVLDVPENGDYSFNLQSDDESWLYLDGSLSNKINQSKLSEKIHLTKGLHTFEIYFIYRGRTGSNLSFTLDEQIFVHPLPANCTVEDIKTNKSNQQASGNNSKVKVAGVEYSYYSAAQALFAQEGTPDVYSIINGQKHFISSPSSFAEYGYDWNRVKKISAKDLAKYPNARLVKLPDEGTIYFLYQRSENKWLKIALNSPTVFVSYPSNYWGNVITINQQDFDSYPSVRLIKTKSDNAVYFLENNIKHFVSDEVFRKKGFNQAEIVEVNKTHLDSYKLGEILK